MKVAPHNRRSLCGAVSVLVLALALLILLPLGLFAFEVARVNMATKQLKVATDSAALAAAALIANSSGTSAENLQKAKERGLDFFRKNMVMSSLLTDTAISPTVDSDVLKSGTGSFDLLIDDTNGRVTARGAFGLQPAFAGFLGLGSHTIHTNSLAGFSGLEGDIIIVVDISDSMTLLSESEVVKRIYNKKDNTVTYRFVRASKAQPNLGRRGAKTAIPPADRAKYELSPLFLPLKDKSKDIQRAAMVEAKRGNLENQAIFESSKASQGILKGEITPQPGFQTDYQRLALEHVQPLADEKTALREFTAELANSPDAHLGLVTFAPRESTGPDYKDSFSTFKGHGYPHVNLSKSNNNIQLVVESLGPCLTFLGTDTKGGLDQAIKMLEGPEHRNSVEKTIILLTDGVPTTGSPKNKAKLAGEKGIRIFAIGFFKSNYARVRGPRVLAAIVAAAGNGSRSYVAPDLPTLRDVLKQIGHGTLSLVNPD